MDITVWLYILPVILASNQYTVG